MGNVTLVIDASRLPAGVSVAPGRILSLGGIDGSDRCFVGAIVTEIAKDRKKHRGYEGGVAVGLCDLCGITGEGPRVLKIATTYEAAEAVTVQHLRRIHGIFTSLWAYKDDLTTEPIP